MEAPHSSFSRLLRDSAILSAIRCEDSDTILVAAVDSIANPHALDLICDIVKEFRGKSISRNNVLVAAFVDAALGVRAALEIQKRLRADTQFTGARIGIHTMTRKPLTAETLRLALDIAERALPAQILVSGGVRDAVATDLSLRYTWLGKIVADHDASQHDVIEILWAEFQSADTQKTDRSPLYPKAPLQSPAPRLVHPDRYEILERIGAGGMGIVYKAREIETGEVIALKVLKPEISFDENIVRRFRNELRLARRITHKNVCRIYDLDRIEGTPCISMELVEGSSLRQVLRKRRAFDLTSGLSLARQICSGLAEAHAQGIVHRDLKPENIMVDNSGQAKIMDFGIAGFVDPGATAVTGVIGTPAYMSPEQAQAKPVDHRSDIYSLGLILYEMFTGVMAVSGDSPAAIALKHVSEVPLPPHEFDPSIPPYVERVILRCLEKDPGRRFQSVQELQDALLGEALWTPSRALELEMIQRPVQFNEWQHSDWILLFSAVVSLIVYLALFEGFHPAPVFRFSLNRNDIHSRLTEKLKQEGVDAQLGQPFLRSYSSKYFDLVSQNGVRAAHQQMAQGTAGTEPFTIWWWVPVKTPSEWTYYPVDGQGRIGAAGTPAISNKSERVSPPGRLIFTGPALIGLVLLLFLYRQLYRQSPVPANVRIAAIVGLGGAAVGTALGFEIPESGARAVLYAVALPLAIFFLTFIITYCVLATVLYYGRRRCPAQISGYLLFIGEKTFSRPVGLEILRGIFVGLIFCAVWMVLVSVGSASGLAAVGLPYWLDTEIHPPLDRSHLSFIFPFVGLAETLIIGWLFVAFPISIMSGFTQRRSYLAAALGCVWLLFGLSLAGPMVLPEPAFELAVLSQGVFLGWVFLKYGISATGSAVLTIEVFLLALPLFVIFERIQPLLQGVAIIVWILTAMGSILIYLGPYIAAGLRRAARVFD
jgi:serine/threonine protein kinase